MIDDHDMSTYASISDDDVNVNEPNPQRLNNEIYSTQTVSRARRVFPNYNNNHSRNRRRDRLVRDRIGSKGKFQGKRKEKRMVQKQPVAINVNTDLNNATNVARLQESKNKVANNYAQIGKEKVKRLNKILRLTQPSIQNSKVSNKNDTDVCDLTVDTSSGSSDSDDTTDSSDSSGSDGDDDMCIKVQNPVIKKNKNINVTTITTVDHLKNQMKLMHLMIRLKKYLVYGMSLN